MSNKTTKITTSALIALTALGSLFATRHPQQNNYKPFKKPETMITVKVSYGVKKEYVAKNKENIALFMKDFKAMSSSDFRYNVYLLDDGTTFVHISSYKNAEVQQRILSTPSFKEFQKQRDESGLIKAHQLEVLHPVALSHE